ncbi:MAG: hypothetical protein OES69_11840 [Myxococcales bacterium]|nr:hypothetical protein [Myxococcales bacterium]
MCTSLEMRDDQLEVLRMLAMDALQVVPGRPRSQRLALSTL